MIWFSVYIGGALAFAIATAVGGFTVDKHPTWFVVFASLLFGVFWPIIFVAMVGMEIVDRVRKYYTK